MSPALILLALALPSNSAILLLLIVRLIFSNASYDDKTLYKNQKTNTSFGIEKKERFNYQGRFIFNS